MEETVGQWWHRWVTRQAYRGYPEKRVELNDRHWIRVYRALSGRKATHIARADGRPVAIQRSVKEKVAGAGRRFVLPEVNADRLVLPLFVDAYESTALNELAYRWMVLIAANWPQLKGSSWRLNVMALSRVLSRYPNIKEQYIALCTAELARRPAPSSAQEQWVQRVLSRGTEGLVVIGSAFEDCVASDIAHLPVAFWLYPSPGSTLASAGEVGDPEHPQQSNEQAQQLAQRKKARRVSQKDDKGGLMAFRLESMFTWEEFAAVDRAEDDTEDDDAASVANDMETMAISRNRSASMASRIKIDLDLPAEENDDLYLGEGIVLPEWDYKSQTLEPQGCVLQAMLPKDAEPVSLPERLMPLVKRIKQQYQQLLPEKQRLYGQQDGEQADLDRYLQHWVEQQGQGSDLDAFYVQHRPRLRNFATLLLADLSYSTDTYINNHQRVIDVVQDGMLMMGEALSACNDRFAMYGFSSKKRQMVRFQCLKNFNERYSDSVRGRVLATRPGFYTRMGAAIRQSTKILAAQPEKQRLLLLISDGKPNDLDCYEGRYGIEDTHQAVLEARKQGIRAFCITIDQEAEDYLPYLFGQQGFLVISKPETLPKRLPKLYAQLTEAS